MKISKSVILLLVAIAGVNDVIVLALAFNGRECKYYMCKNYISTRFVSISPL